jgi:hypothetical protein
MHAEILTNFPAQRLGQFTAHRELCDALKGSRMQAHRRITHHGAMQMCMPGPARTGLTRRDAGSKLASLISPFRPGQYFIENERVQGLARQAVMLLPVRNCSLVHRQKYQWSDVEDGSNVLGSWTWYQTRLMREALSSQE